MPQVTFRWVTYLNTRNKIHKITSIVSWPFALKILYNQTGAKRAALAILCMQFISAHALCYIRLLACGGSLTGYSCIDFTCAGASATFFLFTINGNLDYVRGFSKQWRNVSTYSDHTMHPNTLKAKPPKMNSKLSQDVRAHFFFVFPALSK